jgi:hypothetical protein
VRHLLGRWPETIFAILSGVSLLKAC